VNKGLVTVVRTLRLMTNTHSQRVGPATHTFASSLQGLLEVARAVRSGSDVETLAFRTVVLNVASNNAGRSADELLQVADEAMYAAKRSHTGIEVAA